MRYLAAFVVVAIALMTVSASAAWVTYSNDFESGLGPEMSVLNGSELFTVDDSNSVLRISKPEDDGTTLSHEFVNAGIITNFQLVGDFIVTTDFSLYNLPTVPWPGLNESMLSCTEMQSGETFSLLNFTAAIYSQQKVEVYYKGPHGLSSSTTMQGRYRIARTGTNIGGYLDEGSGNFSLIWQGVGFTDNVQVKLLGLQGTNLANLPRSTSALDISFDNLDIIAKDIVSHVPGDASIDGKVDVSDLGILATYYGTSGAGWGNGDFTGNGLVDVSDLGVLTSNYGTGAITSVPEPSSIALLLIGVSSLLMIRRK